MTETAGENTIGHGEYPGTFITHFGRHRQLLLLDAHDASKFLSPMIKVTLRG